MAASESADRNNGVSTASSEEVKQDKPRPDGTGIVSNKPDADIEPGQQPLEKPSTAGPDTPQQDFSYYHCTSPNTPLIQTRHIDGNSYDLITR